MPDECSGVDLDVETFPPRTKTTNGQQSSRGGPFVHNEMHISRARAPRRFQSGLNANLCDKTDGYYGRYYKCTGGAHNRHGFFRKSLRAVFRSTDFFFPSYHCSPTWTRERAREKNDGARHIYYVFSYYTMYLYARERYVDRENSPIVTTTASCDAFRKKNLYRGYT